MSWLPARGAHGAPEGPKHQQLPHPLSSQGTFQWWRQVGQDSIDKGWIAQRPGYQSKPGGTAEGRLVEEASPMWHPVSHLPSDSDTFYAPPPPSPSFSITSNQKPCRTKYYEAKPGPTDGKRSATTWPHRVSKLRLVEAPGHSGTALPVARGVGRLRCMGTEDNRQERQKGHEPAR